MVGPWTTGLFLLVQVVRTFQVVQAQKRWSDHGPQLFRLERVRGRTNDPVSGAHNAPLHCYQGTEIQVCSRSASKTCIAHSLYLG
jgi:hypothetical protein